MKFYAIREESATPVDILSTWLYRDLYHAEYMGKRNRYGDLPYEPIRLIKNLSLMPPVVIANTRLIVSSELAARLPLGPGVDVCRCVYEFCYWHAADAQSVSTLLEELSPMNDDFAQWRARHQVPSPPNCEYSEVIAIPIPQHHAAEPVYRLSLPPPSYSPKPIEITLAHRAAEAYPIIEAIPYYLLRDDAFDALVEFLPTQLFRVIELTLTCGDRNGVGF